MERGHELSVVVYVGLAILALLIGLLADWSTALIYALIVAVISAAAWLLGRWSWLEKGRLGPRRWHYELETEKLERDMPHLDRRDTGANPGGGL